MPAVLRTLSSIQCPHGGLAILTTANSKARADYGLALLETDVHAVTGCVFTLPNGKPSPCVKIEWKAGAASVKVNGVALLTDSSVGLCYSPENAPQGTAIKSGSSNHVSAR